MGLRAVVADTGDDGDTLVEERRARAASPLERRDSRVTSVSAFAFLVSCAALQLAFPGDRHPSIGLLVLLIAGYAVASKVEFEVGIGSAIPTQLVFVPMLFLLPPSMVPLCVAVGLLLGSMVEKLNKVVHIERQLVQRLGREPRPDEIAAELEMTTAEVREILRMSQLPVSLEKPIGEEEESELGDFVQDDQAESPFDSASLNLRREDIDRALDSLPERERKVIELRFGLKGESPRTLEEVGRAFGVTRERIRQIENNTLKKLESLPEAQGLKDCVL